MKKKEISNSLSSRLLSVFSKSASVLGDVKMEGDLRIDGTVVGGIDCDGRLIIGSDGHIQGTVRSKSIDLRGKLSGDVYAAEMCILRATAIYRGKICTSKIKVEAGADFCGDCQTEYATEGSLRENIPSIA